MRYQLLTFICALIVTLTGCDKIKSRFDEWKEVGKSVQGRPIRMAELGKGDRTIFLFGAIHGDEQAGEILLNNLHKYLKEHPKEYKDKRVLIMPVANPDGFAANTRQNDNDVDLNRNFPTRDWSPKPTRKKYKPGSSAASEPETQTLIRIIDKEKPRIIISIHQPLECINYDGPATTLAQILVRATNLPLKNNIGYNTPGSLGTYYGKEKSIPVITMELSKQVELQKITNIYIPALVQIISSF